MIAQRTIFDCLSGAKCLHCQRRKQARARGLCHPCHADKDIRRQYPASDSKYSRWMHGETIGVSGTGSLPPDSTDAAPGSDEKIRIMQERARRGESLFHPDDLTQRTRGDGCRISSAISVVAKVISAEIEYESCESL